MDRKAIEMEFHWIFVLIAGAVILTFFFSLVQKQQDLSERKLSVTLAAQMDAIFTGAIESKGTTQTLVTPQPGIAFSCNNVCECAYTIGEKTTEFSDKLMFAPPLLKGQDAVAWALDWKLPFRIANFLILTNPTIKYYVVYETSESVSERLHARLKKALAAELNVETLGSLSSAYDMTYQGESHTRFIFLGTSEPSLSSLHTTFEEQDVSGVWIKDERSAVFSDKTDPDELSFREREVLLAGDATAYAAMFSADADMYECMLKRGFGKMAIVAEVNHGRARELKEALIDRPECQYILQDIDNVRMNAAILSASKRLNEQVPEVAEAFGTIRVAQGELQRQNDNLLRQSCPELY